MSKKILIVVDMQNDFIDGVLGNPYNKEVVLPNVIKKVKQANRNGNYVFFTCDTHFQRDFHESIEGQRLPLHCEFNTHGWQINEELSKVVNSSPILVWKPTFGKLNWKEYIGHLVDDDVDENTEIELCGLCTDICVVSNALILRAMYPNNKITIDSSCCGGTTPEAHESALTVMRSCMIDIV